MSFREGKGITSEKAKCTNNLCTSKELTIYRKGKVIKER